MAKMVKVKLPRISKKQRPQFVSVNNYTATIKPGEEVEVPDFVAAMLKNRDEMLEIVARYEEENQQRLPK
jgi:hypothetical protein